MIRKAVLIRGKSTLSTFPHTACFGHVNVTFPWLERSDNLQGLENEHMKNTHCSCSINYWFLISLCIFLSSFPFLWFLSLVKRLKMVVLLNYKYYLGAWKKWTLIFSSEWGAYVTHWNPQFGSLGWISVCDGITCLLWGQGELLIADEPYSLDLMCVAQSSVIRTDWLLVKCEI